MGKATRRNHTHPDEGRQQAMHYRDELLEARTELGTTSGQLLEARRTVAALQVSLTESQKTVLSQERAIADLEHLVSVREAEVRAARADAAAAEQLVGETDAGAAKAALAKANARLSTQNVELDMARASLAATKVDLEKAETALRAETNRTHDLEAKLAKVTDRLASLDRTNADLRTKYEACDRDRSDLRTKGQTVLLKLAEKEKLILDYADQMRKAAETIEKLESRSDDMVHARVSGALAAAFSDFDHLSRTLDALGPRGRWALLGDIPTTFGGDYIAFMGPDSIHVMKIPPSVVEDAVKLADAADEVIKTHPPKPGETPKIIISPDGTSVIPWAVAKATSDAKDAKSSNGTSRPPKNGVQPAKELRSDEVRRLLELGPMTADALAKETGMSIWSVRDTLRDLHAVPSAGRGGRWDRGKAVYRLKI